MQTQLNLQAMLDLDALDIEVNFDSDCSAIATQHINSVLDISAKYDDKYDELVELNYHSGYYIEYLTRLLEDKKPKFILSEYLKPADHGYCINGEYGVYMNDNSIIVFHGSGDEFESIEISLGHATVSYRYQTGNTLGCWYVLSYATKYGAITTFLHPAVFAKILEFVN